MSALPDTPLQIGVIDYGAGNLRSVQNALRQLGATSCVLAEPTGIAQADGIILPGVGSFGSAAASLERTGLAEELRRCAGDKPLLGICLGMQLLFDSSEETPGVGGLGLLPGRVRALVPGPSRKVPNMGWCSVATTRSGLTGSEGSVASYYFAHSYVCEPDDDSVISACVTDCGDGFAAVVESGQLSGTQFHPEKSGPDGLLVLRRFLASCLRGRP
jgi:glutamine amidotransferase